MPPSVPKPARVSMSRRSKLLIGLAFVPACLVGVLIVLRVCGLLRPFLVPAEAMTPAVSAGDRVLMEGMTFVVRSPRRGDVVVFRSDGIAALPAGIYIKRIAGEPGDHLRISDGQLFINGKQVCLSNALGQIVYDLPPQFETLALQTDVTVPSGCYFVLGDNATNSFDSRFWGSLPHSNIIGRVALCYWPPERVGGAK